MRTNHLSGRRYTTQTIRFTGNRKQRTAKPEQVNLMRVHGFQFSTSNKEGDVWVMEYSRIATVQEGVSKKLLAKLGDSFSIVKENETLLSNKGMEALA
jgi:hypothetical protein